MSVYVIVLDDNGNTEYTWNRKEFDIHEATTMSIHEVEVHLNL